MNCREHVDSRESCSPVAGKWSDGNKKPFMYNEYLQKKLQLESGESEADRYVPPMPNIQENGRPNLRKLGQLPSLLIKLGRFQEFISEVSECLYTLC